MSSTFRLVVMMGIAVIVGFDLGALLVEWSLR